jgi:tetratricopeptide (TPR) repeat protein
MPAKKQAESYLRIAEAYINAPNPNKNLDEASKLIDAAEKLDPTNPEVFLLRGDYLLEKDAVNGTPAIKQYEKAATLDPKSPKAQLRIGQLWVRANNLTSGVENFQKAIDLDSTYAPAWRAKGEVLLRAKRLESSKAAFVKYLQLNDEPGARLRYASALYLSNDFKNALAELETVRKQDSTQILLWRLLSYCYYETGDYAHAKYAVDKYFRMTTSMPNWRIVSYDYEYRGKTTSKLGQDSLGLIDMQKAYDMDSTRRQLLFDMGGIAYKWKKYDLAANYFQKKINTGEVTASDYLNLGRAYYSMKNYAMADSSFGMVIQKQPSAAAGYFWRARARLAVDTVEDRAGLTKGLAKPDYEKHIELVMAGTAPDKVERNKKDLIESYSYLGSYHFDRKNYGCSKYYYQEIQKLDPNNEQAKVGLADKAIAAATAADPATCK